MRLNKHLCSTFPLILFTLLLGGCTREQPAASPQAQSTPAPAQSGGWQPVLPANLASLAIKDGGACYLDALNGAVIENGPIRMKAGTPVSLAGWAAADLKLGTVGSALAVQLNSAAPYFAAAMAYQRTGLGAALKNQALDAGGFRLDTLPMNVPAGNYRILFLIQSGSDLLRCDTGRDLVVE